MSGMSSAHCCLHLLADHLDLPLREGRAPWPSSCWVRRPRKCISERALQVAYIEEKRPDGQDRAGHLAGDAGGEHLLVGLVRLAVGVLHGAGGEVVLLLGALDELVLAGAALLDQLAGLAGDVEDRLELPVAAGFLVVRPADAVPHELAEDEDRGADEEGHRVVLEGAAVPVPHQVVDQALGALGVLRGAPPGTARPPWRHGRPTARRRRARAVLDQLDGHLAAEAGAVCRGLIRRGCRSPAGSFHDLAALGRRPDH